MDTQLLLALTETPEDTRPAPATDTSGAALKDANGQPCPVCRRKDLRCDTWAPDGGVTYQRTACRTCGFVVSLVVTWPGRGPASRNRLFHRTAAHVPGSG